MAANRALLYPISKEYTREVSELNYWEPFLIIMQCSIMCLDSPKLRTLTKETINLQGEGPFKVDIGDLRDLQVPTQFEVVQNLAGNILLNTKFHYMNFWIVPRWMQVSTLQSAPVAILGTIKFPKRPIYCRMKGQTLRVLTMKQSESESSWQYWTKLKHQ